ncbi:MAG TPA: glycogen/starch synthase [Elusimicrobiota bacterium]|nr:glycogen/starch synthase [Elusimicrobiota bacterium]
MKILIAASECAPFCGTGGLSDVIRSLSGSLKAKQHDVRIVLPKYKAVGAFQDQLRSLGLRCLIPIGDSYETIRLWEFISGHTQCPVYFVDSPKYYDRDHLYQGFDGKPYPDNDERFILFCRAALETCKAVDFRPDIIHSHDWHAGLIPAYLSTLYRIDSFFLPTASVHTVHDIANQGLFPKNTHFHAGFPWSDYVPERLEYYGQFNFLKAGLVFADVLTSPTFGFWKNVQEHPETGQGLAGVVGSRSLDCATVVNGTDEEGWSESAENYLLIYKTALEKMKSRIARPD